MPLYEASREGLYPVAPTTFMAKNWTERGDIQRILRDNLSTLEDGLLLLTDEFSGWIDSARRIDMLCLDKEANLVVIELKRGEDGGHMDLQALRYAAMVSAMTFEQAVDTLALYRNRHSPDHVAARADVLAHCQWTSPDEAKFAASTRILLVAADFNREITTTVLWLRNYDVDVSCLRIRPYDIGNDKLLLQVEKLIPLPETADFEVTLKQKRAAERKEIGDRATLSERFLNQLAEVSESRIDALKNGRVNNGALSYSMGSGFYLSYVAAKDRSRIELLVVRKDCSQCLQRLKEHKADIEADFGEHLEWREKEGVAQCRICHLVKGGYAAAECDWLQIQEGLVSAMVKLDVALRDRVIALTREMKQT